MLHTVRRGLALLLCLLLTLTLTPLAARAEEDTLSTPETLTEAPADVPEAPVDLPETPVDLPDTPVDLPDTPVDLPDTPEAIPDTPEVIPEESEAVPAPVEESAEALEPIPVALAESDLPEIPTEADPADADPLESETPDPETPETPDAPAQPPAPLVLAEEIDLGAEGLDDGTDPAALLDAYAEQVIQSALPRRRMLLRAVKSSGSRLTGHDAEVYAALRAMAERIAAGEQSTPVATITVVESWTAEDLGLPSLIINNSYQDAVNAAYALAYSPSPNFGTIMRCVLADCPYEMYWCDKTASAGLSLGRTPSTGETEITVTSEISITLRVSPDYADPDDPGLVDTSLGTAVHTAVAQAQQIAASYAGYGPYARLAAYRDEICALTSYNYSAASDASRAYGDPWQLIWVFDGDAGTTVVCEGYAKAFQYLCDLSGLSDCVCCTVTGDMQRSGGSSEGHMWNIVTMDDGRNYLVDVTNCDSGTVGYPDLLFMKAAEGDPSSYYRFPCGSVYIYYTYDSEMYSVFSTEDLTLSLSDYSGPPAPVYEPGDVNHSGRTDADDALQLLRYLAQPPLESVFSHDSEAELAARRALADLDGDGVPTEADAILIQRRSIGLDNG